jgi:transposase InsO family protein
MSLSLSTCSPGGLSAGESRVRRKRPSCSTRSNRLFAIGSLFAAVSFITATAQYVSIKYSERLADAGVEPSVGSVGDSYDNALAETVNGLYKAEVIWRRGPWRSLDQVEFATLEWVDWFNNRRLLEPIGNIPPAEAEARYYAQIEEPAMVA